MTPVRVSLFAFSLLAFVIGVNGLPCYNCEDKTERLKPNRAGCPTESVLWESRWDKDISYRKCTYKDYIVRTFFLLNKCNNANVKNGSNFRKPRRMSKTIAKPNPTIKTQQPLVRMNHNSQACYVCNPCEGNEARPEDKIHCTNPNSTGCSSYIVHFLPGGRLLKKYGTRVMRNCTNINDANLPLNECLGVTDVLHGNGKMCFNLTFDSAEDVKRFYACYQTFGREEDESRKYQENQIPFFTISGCYCEGDACNDENVEVDPSFVKSRRTWYMVVLEWVYFVKYLLYRIVLFYLGYILGRRVKIPRFRF